MADNKATNIEPPLVEHDAALLLVNSTGELLTEMVNSSWGQEVTIPMLFSNVDAAVTYRATLDNRSEWKLLPVSVWELDIRKKRG